MFSTVTERHDAVQALIDACDIDTLQDLLGQLGDVERIVGRIGIGNARREIWTSWLTRWG